MRKTRKTKNKKKMSTAKAVDKKQNTDVAAVTLSSLEALLISKKRN